MHRGRLFQAWPIHPQTVPLEPHGEMEARLMQVPPSDFPVIGCLQITNRGPMLCSRPHEASEALGSPEAFSGRCPQHQHQHQHHRLCTSCVTVSPPALQLPASSVVRVAVALQPLRAVSVVASPSLLFQQSEHPSVQIHGPQPSSFPDPQAKASSFLCARH
jgi:hypothetical protein